MQLSLISLLPSVILLIFTFDLCWADQWNPNSFVAACGNAVPTSWLCDPDSLLSSEDELVIEQLESVNNNTMGEIYYGFVFYNGYVIAAAVVESVVGDGKDPVLDFAKAVQKSWFGGRVCDNSTLVVTSLNTSSVRVFPGECIETRIRTHHKDLCSDIRISASNIADGTMECIDAVEGALQEALSPYSNAPWGYAGVAVIMTMLIFHYWIKY